MSSYVALHIRAPHNDALVEAIGPWLNPYGFGEFEKLDAKQPDPHRFAMSATTVMLGRLNAEWSIARFDGFNLGGRSMDAELLQPLAEQLGSRTVLFTGQTNSDTYQLVVFEGANLVRHVLVGDCECLINAGAQLPGEREGAFSFPEAEDDTDQDVPSPMDDASAICSAMGFELWSEKPLAGTVHVWKRQGFFARLMR